MLSAFVASKYCSLVLNISVAVFPTLFFCSILLWPFFWLCILSFLCIKYIILSKKRCWVYLKLAKMTLKSWEVLEYSSHFYYYFLFLFFIKPIDKLYPKFQFWLLFYSNNQMWKSSCIFIYNFILVYNDFVIFNFKNIISSWRCSCYIYIFNFLNGLNLCLLKGLRET